MKAQVLPDNLKAGLKWIKPATAKRTFLPVLENVLVEVTSQGVRLTATNLDLAASALIGGKVEKAGRTTVPFKALETLAKSLPNEPLECYRKRNGHLALTQGSRTVLLETIDPGEFPITPVAKGKTYKALGDLLDGCKFVEHALAKDESRPILTYAEAKKGKLAAADGYRLAMAPAFGGEGSLSKSLVRFLARCKEEPAKLTVDDKFVTVWFPSTLAGFPTGSLREGQGGDNWISSQQCEGNFPDWKQVIPKVKWAIKVDFVQFLDKVQLIAKLKPVSKMLILKPKRGRLYLEAKTEELTITDWLAASCNGKNEPFAFNVYYLLDALHARKPFLPVHGTPSQHREGPDIVGSGKEGWIKLKGQGANSGVMLMDQHTRLIEVVMPMHISA